MASRAVHRVTMFKIPEAANVQPILDQYAKLQSEAKKVGVLRERYGKQCADA